MNSHANIRSIASQLSTGELSCEQLMKDRLAMAHKTSGVFLFLDDEIILEQAREVDRQRAAGQAKPLSGIPISLKDLFNVQGQRTLAGSVLLTDTAPIEEHDAEVVAHLRDAGLLCFGRTNMSEFAFSGIGLNEHFPPLYSVWNTDGLRIPGGSSSGSAVSVALGIVPATLGSDTTGSCRIPAAFNGIVGMKPSHGRLAQKGVYPLSHSCDVPGPLAVDVDSCFLLDQLMQGKPLDELPTLPVADMTKVRLLIPQSSVIEDLDPEVETAFYRSVQQLETAGAVIIRTPLPALDQCIDMFRSRNTVLYEAWQVHHELIKARGNEYGDYVRSRIESGRDITEQEQQARYVEKAALTQQVQQALSALNIDAMIYPTVPCIPPLFAETEDPEKMGPINLRCLRNTSTVNYFDGCAMSLPCHTDGEAPVGLMVSSVRNSDERLLEIAAGIEQIL